MTKSFVREIKFLSRAREVYKTRTPGPWTRSTVGPPPWTGPYFVKLQAEKSSDEREKRYSHLSGQFRLEPMTTIYVTAFNIYIVTYKQWPTYLNLQRVSIVRELRSSDCIRLQVPLEKGTFQDTTAALFNNLPK